MKKQLRKIRKNAKALSPVVASIILIAVTVAVSIAVAAWMGALTVGFMGSSSMTITDVSFASGNAITINAKNTGTNKVTIASVKVNNVAPTSWSANATSASAGDVLVLSLTQAYTDGQAYKFDLFDNSGQVVGSYQANAPA
jgi:flagellin-like protein